MGDMSYINAEGSTDKIYENVVETFEDVWYKILGAEQCKTTLNNQFIFIEQWMEYYEDLLNKKDRSLKKIMKIYSIMK